jgi:predicted O-methyltransferase YrrM
MRRRSNGALDHLRALRRDLRFLLALRVLPARVALFQWRASRLAGKLGDDFGRVSATRPTKLAALLALAKGRRQVVELGTAMGWTAISLALADEGREILTFDPIERAGSAEYLSLVPADVRDRVTAVLAPGDRGPSSDRAVELLYIDSTHSREDTIGELAAWRPVLRDDALVIFDDYGHPGFPGVKEAVEELGLDGYERAGLFVHRCT